MDIMRCARIISGSLLAEFVLLAAISCLAACVSPAKPHDKEYHLPLELSKLAQEYDCDYLDDYLDRDGNLQRRYAYGYFPGKPEDSAVFWCAKKDAGLADVRPFTDRLIFIYKTNHELAQCPREVIWRYQVVGGLSIYFGHEETLDYFHYIDGGGEAPKGIYMKYPAILISDDGLDATLYCHQGRWLVRIRD